MIDLAGLGVSSPRPGEARDGWPFPYRAGRPARAGARGFELLFFAARSRCIQMGVPRTHYRPCPWGLYKGGQRPVVGAD
jgi:hypothetical protein